ncbi:MAG TPA: GNAT family N-acetyltransferase [Burkholderiaceae bacterium]|nr:GNAT family N-acetyltransferase [Burkholderiaceae bacterium]HQR72609.1 GNAT family N-acetyltransferase [Burkholderiaceae bacterium]
MHEALDVTIRPLTSSRWRDLETVFGAKGCSVARGCWCMYYRESGQQTVPSGMRLAEVRKERLHALCAAGPPPGLLAYDGRTPVGWVTLGPRREYLKLANSPVMKPVDEVPVWSIVCFVVPPEYRHQGVATALLRGAIDYAAKRGARILEAYPVDPLGPARDDSMWHGAKSMYDRAGFVEVARRRPQRPVMRIELRPSVR